MLVSSDYPRSGFGQEPSSVPARGDRAFDIWTVGHFLVGAVMANIGYSRAFAYAVIAGTEIVEAGFRRRGLPFFDESTQNVVADLFSSAAGYELFRKQRAEARR